MHDEFYSLKEKLKNFKELIHAYSQASAEVFLVVANTRTESIQKQIKSIDVDKMGSEKPLAS